MKQFFLIFLLIYANLSVLANENQDLLSQELMNDFPANNDETDDVDEEIESDVNLLNKPVENDVEDGENKGYKLHRYAILQGINKITTKTSELKIEIGKSSNFGNLYITVKSCWSAPYELSQESKILLHVFESSADGLDDRQIFYGWLFSSSSGISSVAHPVYDILAIKCVDN